MRSLISIALAAIGLGALIACTPIVPTARPPSTAVSHVSVISPTHVASPISSGTLTAAATRAASAAPGSTLCPRPADWSAYRVMANDTIYSLARELGITVEAIRQANCLPTDLLQIGQELFLPLPTCTVTTPSGWIKYVVRAGDTLAVLAQLRRVSLDEVKQANCLTTPGAANNLTIGQVLFLPPLPPAAAEPVIVPSGGLRPVALHPERLKVPRLRLAALSPGENFIPCTSTLGSSIDWSTQIDDGKIARQAIGTAQYYFPCEFGAAGIVQASFTGPEGETRVRLIGDVPDPDPKWNAAHGRLAAVVGAECWLTSGLHLLRIWDSLGHQAEQQIYLDDLEYARPLVLPPGGPVGTPFEAFWCGYADRTDQPIQFGLYRYVGDDENHDRVFTGVTALSVTINSETGWASLILPPAALNVSGVYALAEDDPLAEGNVPVQEFWVTP